MIPLLDRFRDEHPDIHLRIESDAAQDIRGLLQNGEADAIFSIQYDFDNRDMEQIICRYFGDTTHCACMKKTNPLAGEKSIAVDDLRLSEFICISPQVLPEYVHMLHELCQPYGFVPNITNYVASANSLTLNIQTDQEVFICDKYYLDGNFKNHVIVPIRDTLSQIVLAWRKDNPKPYLSDLIRTAEEVFHQ